MKFKIGVILIVLQVLAVFGTAAGGGFSSMGAVEMIGYFLPSIIGVILIIMSKKKP